MTASLSTRFLMAAAALAVLAFGSARADEADIRKTLAERYPNLPKADEIRPAPMAGLWELRFGTDLMYSDAKGNYLIQGSIIDTAAKRNLTEERIEKLTAIDFGTLPLKDAIVWKTGTGKRKIAVFADPNCGYCKKFERDLQSVKDLTVYTFLIPILGGDSPEKSKAIWCAKDSTAAWRNWMIEGTQPPRQMGQCDSAALERNMALSRKHRVNGTPAIVFEDGSRSPGAMSAADIEKRLGALGKS
jgi:thiol:disulfide interchange protein DsbC